MCGVHFTDQQYEYDTSTGEVTVEWEGTGPSASVQVSQFECKVDQGAESSCECVSYLTEQIIYPCN